METLLLIAGAALGLVVPFLFTHVLTQGVERSPFPLATKARLKTIAIAVVGAWTLLVWAASLIGLIRYQPGDFFPRFVIPLIVPVVAAVALAASSSDFRTMLDHAPLGTLVGVQAFRLAGVAFLLIVYLGILPPPFARAGYGDLATGALALATSLALASKSRSSHTLFWLFFAVGLYDLMSVAYLLLAYHPLYNDTVPSSAPAFEFSLVLIPALAAPMALLLHLFALRTYLHSEATTPLRSAGVAH
jgi:nitrate reductase NapE component